MALIKGNAVILTTHNHPFPLEINGLKKIR
jgi:hypothetical protein